MDTFALAIVLAVLGGVASFFTGRLRTTLHGAVLVALASVGFVIHAFISTDYFYPSLLFALFGFAGAAKIYKNYKAGVQHET